MPVPRPSLRVLFLEALDIEDPARRIAYLDRACGADTDLRRKLEELLALDAEASGFLTRGADAGAPADPEPDLEGRAARPEDLEGKPPAEPHLHDNERIGRNASPHLQNQVDNKPGDKIGRYKLLEKIGDGGFGVVYMAEQQEPVRRRVALKIIKPGLETKLVVARFEAERQALALMDHPNIAKVFDGGVVGSLGSAKSEIDTGRPYFVMELVPGSQLTDYCDQHQLSLRERLELFGQVCSAVQHAHQKGIIHRDLKPSNILVTENDGVPVPKVIDFGIAKATEQKLTDKTFFTQFAQFIGTPAYMSPEQTALTSLDIDTRSDIYSLGVLLYELLTGHPPFDTRDLLKIGLDELCRTLREVEPPRPSTRLSTLAGDARAQVAQRCNTPPPKLVNLVRGDLDWIVMKCLEKDRSRRYETANALAADIHRHLHSEPITARPPRTAYRFQKFFRRNRLAVIASTAVGLAFVVGSVVSTWQAVRATRAEREQSRLRQTAQTEATRSRQVADLLQDMLGGVHPEKARGRDTTVLRDVLQRAVRRIDSDLKDQPLVAADLRITLGRVYIALADLTNGVAMFRQALALRQQVYSTQHVDIVHALLGLGHALVDARQYVEGEKTLRDALAMSIAVRGRDDAITARVLNSLAFSMTRQLRYADGEPIAREAVALLKRHLGERHADVGAAEISFGEALSRQHKYAEAETVLAESVAILKRVHGEDDPLVSSALSALGHALLHGGKPAAAEPIFQEALQLDRKLYGEEHPNVAASLEHLAQAFIKLGRYAEAEPLSREALAVYRKAFGAEHSLIADTLNGLGWALAHQKKNAEAEQHLRESLVMKEKLLGRAHPDVVVALNGLGSLLSVQGRHTEAERLFREALDICLKLFGPSHMDVSSAYQNLGVALENQERPAEAEAAFKEALAIRRKLPGYDHPNTARALRHLAFAMMQQDRHAEAEAPLQEALTLYQKFNGDDDRNTGKTFELLLACLERQRNWAKAIPLQRRQLERVRRQRPNDHPETLNAVAALGRSLTEWAWMERSNTVSAEAVRLISSNPSGSTEGQNQNPVAPTAINTPQVDVAREAERSLRECLKLRESRPNASRGLLGDTQSRLGAAVLAATTADVTLDLETRQTGFTEAERLLLSGHSLMQRSTSAPVRSQRDGLERLVRLYTVWEELAPRTGHAAQAAEWKLKLAAFDQTAAKTKPDGAEPQGE